MQARQTAIVGIGASAGGVKALEQLFRNMPPDSGMGFVVVTHMPRDHVSLLPGILQRFTPMPVEMARDDAPVLANHILVAPPDAVPTMAGGRILLHPRGTESGRRPIDVFLSSLAQDAGEAAIGILLSGSNEDGTLGAKAIKEHGGLTIAQVADGTAPAQPQMPDAAIAAGVIDLELPVQDIGARLMQLAGTAAPQDEAADDGFAAVANPIQQLLLDQVGHDFSGYKPRSFERRTRRRMQVLQLARPDAYLERLKTDPNEVRLLLAELLVSVTSFFRDADAFAALEREMIPKLFEGRGPGDTVRVWVPGCATGEECYSIAILLREQMDRTATPPRVQVFATDIDETALAVARAGRYPAALLQGMAPERLARNFVAHDVSYQVARPVRDLCVFSSHSVVRDPPFSRMDLISCRNLLIYLGPEFQRQVLPVFHFALRPGGFLFLGISENVSQHAMLFRPLDKKHRLFQRRDKVSAPLPSLPGGGRLAAIRAGTRPPPASPGGLRRMAEARVLEAFAPAHVVVTQEGDVVHYSAGTGRYLEAAPGAPSRNLVSLARELLRLELRSALAEAVATGRRVTRPGVPVELGGQVQMIDLVIDPLEEEGEEKLLLVVFTDVGAPEKRPPAGSARDEAARALQQTESELRETRERMQGAIEEYETAVEELKSSNEELQSLNEEMQSANEELETSKEELQSVNEELQGVNAQLATKLGELDSANSDLRNLFETSQTASIFLDHTLRIRSFTPPAAALFNLIRGDRGRRFSDIAGNLQADLGADVAAVLAGGPPVECEVSRIDGRAHFLVRILPYLAEDDTVEGVVISIVDVTTLWRAKAQLSLLIDELNHRVRNMLAVISAISEQMARGARSVPEFTERFRERLRGMAAAYTLVSRRNWEPVSLRDVLGAQLASCAGVAGRRILLEGPEVPVKPTAALSLGLVAHELAANAIKHGALAAPQGQLRVEWRLQQDPPALLLRWQETGGPKPVRPQHEGLGSKLVAGELTQKLGATTVQEFDADGLVLQAAIPLHEEFFGKMPG